MNLNKSIYSFRNDISVWARADYTGIPYSDGEQQEKKLLEIVRNTKDLSVYSAELKSQCLDWVTTYHFTSLRSNLLRPLENLFYPGQKVLEIGAGCGAITRYLGEAGADILALEGSLRRAEIARSRTKDLTNVTVISERFDDFVIDEKFDVITLIGVLEYSNLFSEGPDSAINMLARVKEKLKPTGKLIIAIENQLGLKYFSGAAEDHIGQAMYGVEGRYTKEQAETYGYYSLLEKLASTGLVSIETLLPFPDYKMPVSVVTERGADDNLFDASVFATQSVRADMQLPDELNFVPELVWPVVFKNKLGIDLSNSLLLVASAVNTDSYDKDILAIHFGSERHASYRKKTIFKYRGDEISVLRKKETQAKPIENEKIGFSLDGFEKYIVGKPLVTEFVKIVTTPGWSIEYVAGYFRYYLECLEIALKGEGVIYEDFNQFTVLPPEYLDAIPSNFVLDNDGQPRYFEREWLAKEGLTLGHLVFRSILSLIGKVSAFAMPENNSPLTRGEFIYSLFAGLSFEANENLFSEYLLLESELHAFSLGIAEEKIETWYPEHILPGLTKRNEEIQIQKSLHSYQHEVKELTLAKSFAEKLCYERLATIDFLEKENDSCKKRSSEESVKIKELEENIAILEMEAERVSNESERLRQELEKVNSHWVNKIIRRLLLKDR